MGGVFTVSADAGWHAGQRGGACSGDMVKTRSPFPVDLPHSLFSSVTTPAKLNFLAQGQQSKADEMKSQGEDAALVRIPFSLFLFLTKVVFVHFRTYLPFHIEAAALLYLLQPSCQAINFSSWASIPKF